MHELSIAISIVEIAEENAKNANATIINEIELDIGTQSGVVLDALEFAMKSAVIGTMLENAIVRINSIKARGKCTSCDHEFIVEEIFQECPACGNPFSVLIEGKELKVKSLLAE